MRDRNVANKQYIIIRNGYLFLAIALLAIGCILLMCFASESQFFHSFIDWVNAQNHDYVGYLAVISIFLLLTTAILLLNRIREMKIQNRVVHGILREKETILKEVHHRIKNNMSSMIGFLYLQRESINDANALKVIDDTESRLRSMMVLYDKLYKSPDFTKMEANKYFPSLVEQIVENFPNQKMVKLVTSFGDFELDAKRLMPVGIIINELITNVMKYAFVGRSEGHIHVSGKLVGPKVFIEIKDDGIGIPASIDFKSSTGYGLSLVNGLVAQIDGSIKITQKDGTIVSIEFPY